MEKSDQRLAAMAGELERLRDSHRQLEEQMDQDRLSSEEREFIRRRLKADKAMGDFWISLRLKLLDRGLTFALIAAAIGLWAFVQYKMTGTVPEVLTK
ncbi:hypothetical protein DV711_06070 [Motiliproteus coralliicola]|uniref:Uncharacterized protein n=1 Tax=Motiliproteus coralliicola TaxID=2283196 RepID=A0A369WU43_9GAMM|nr:hypothetical protein [Motiliproteus coralliicola]RDE25121.1 hypothetical protein DV711_06070 [Motiliproteus coralliicola]